MRRIRRSLKSVLCSFGNHGLGVQARVRWGRGGVQDSNVGGGGGSPVCVMGRGAGQGKGGDGVSAGQQVGAG